MGRKDTGKSSGRTAIGRTKKCSLTRDEAYKVKGCEIFHNLKDAMEFLKQFKSEDIYIIAALKFTRHSSRTATQPTSHGSITSTWRIPGFRTWIKTRTGKLQRTANEQTYFDLCYEFRRYERTGKKALELGEV